MTIVSAKSQSVVKASAQPPMKYIGTVARTFTKLPQASWSMKTSLVDRVRRLETPIELNSSKESVFTF